MTVVPFVSPADFDVDDLLADLETLVSIESPSHDIVALERSAEAVAALFRRRAGVDATLVAGPDGTHVHVAASTAPRVLIVGHHDTVFPLGTLAARPFAVDDGRVSGPGVFDMKGGVVLAAHALGRLRPGQRAGVEVLISADEEVGSMSSKELLLDRAAACGYALVLEGAADGGALKTGRKGIGTFSVNVTGRAAHAGLEPHKGVNALVEAAAQIAAIVRLAAPDRGTTVTPTMASAGTAENVVPAQAHVRVDVRVAEIAEGERVEQALHALSPVDRAAVVEVLGRISRPPMTETMSTELFGLAGRVAARAGLAAPVGVAVGGASDGNFTAAAGIPTLDGLGAVGGGAHADHEWVDVAALAPRAALVSGLLAELTA